MKKEVRLDHVTRLVNHGPVVLVSSVYEGRVNITPVAWHMPVLKNPPMIALEIGDNHFIYDCIVATGDFVINVPSRVLLEEIVKCGSHSGREIDKFDMCGLTHISSREVQSPALKEALAVMECVLVKDEHLMSKYNIVLAEVKYAEADTEAFNEHWLFTSDDMTTVHHLGDRTFCFPAKGIVDLRQKQENG